MTLVSPTVHVHPLVRDLAESVRFYRLLFGTEPVTLLPGYAKFLPGWGPFSLRPVPGRRGRARQRDQPSRHPGLASPAEVQRQHVRGLPQPECRCGSEMGVDCCHADADKLRVSAPAGIEWVIYCLNHELGPATTSGASVCTTNCCPA